MISEGFRVSPQQKRLLARGLAARPAFARYELAGPVRLDLLAEALLRLVRRQEILRTRFVKEPGVKSYLQVIEADVPVQFVACFAAGPDPAPIFAVDRAPLFRFGYREKQAGTIELEMWVAGICCDAPSFALWLEELAEIYACLTVGANTDAPVLQYLHFAEWWNDAVAEEEDADLVAQGKAFWEQAPTDEPCDLPFSRNEKPSSAPERYAFHFDDTALHALCTQAGLMPEDFLLTCWQILLYKLSGCRRLPLGILADARKFDELETLPGLLSEVVPFDKRLDPRASFATAWSQNAQHRGALREWLEYYDDSPQTGRTRFDFAFETAPPATVAGSVRFALDHMDAFPSDASLVLRCRQVAGQIHCELGGSDLSARQLQELAEQFASLAAGNFDTNLAIDRLDVRGAAEQAYWLALNGAEAITSRASLPRRIHDQAVANPARTALYFEGEALTYGELERRANRLAHRLKAAGVAAESLVALMAHRDPAFFVGLLAIWKAGGAYVPLAPGTPPARARALILQMGGPVWLSTRAEDAWPGGPDRIDPANERAWGEQPEHPPVCDLHPQNLAYAIMTSGSTGVPKAVLVPHAALQHYVDAAIERLDLRGDGVYGQVSALHADLGHTMIFPALSQGGCLHLAGDGAVVDPLLLEKAFGQRPIDYLKIAPTHLASLLLHPCAGLLPRRALVLGGEAVPAALIEHVHTLAPGCAIYNHYGPTETTVGVIAGLLSPDATELPLGKPLAGTRLHLLDKQGTPVPRGVLGEIHVGGANLCRGYRDMPDQTAAAFVPAPHGSRRYRSGDQAAVNDRGQLIFKGRRDDQVKIRGFRVEPGEIATVLRDHPAIADAAVLAVARPESGNLMLVAYVVPSGSEKQPPALEAWLAERLAEHLRPQHIISLKALPYTANGKLAREALPHPLAESGATPYRPPGNAVEEALCRAWSEVLGPERVGIDDNYFALGGDSITSIQIMSRARRYGVELYPKLVFDHPTVAELAEHCTRGQVAPVTDDEEGPVKPGPIQQWFLELGLNHPHHWNMTLFLFAEQRLDPSLLECALHALVAQHGALRLGFDPKTGIGRVLPAGDTLCFEAVDLSRIDDEHLAPVLEREAAARQRNLNLVDGPLFRLVLFDPGDGRSQRLLFVAHHLVIDGVSWRIVLEDLAAAYADLQQGRPPQFGAKTLSPAAWTELCTAYANSQATRAETAFWLRPAPVTSLPNDREDFRNRVADTRIETLILEERDTADLLQRFPAIYRSQINDVLLTALATALGRWLSSPSVSLWLEGHGREMLGDQSHDLSRSVGWFTTHFPVHLHLPAGDPGTRLIAVKRQLRAIPNNGIGYGLLRYLGPEDVRRALESAPRPELRFNYLGRLDSGFAADAPFRPAAEDPGPQRHDDDVRTCVLGVNACVRNGCLEARFDYDASRHKRETIATLAADFQQALLDLIDHCRQAASGVLVPEDFPAAQLDSETLNAVVRTLADRRGQSREETLVDLEDLYRLSPIQHGILFHHMRQQTDDLYFRQMSWTFNHDLDPAAFRQAWSAAVAAHPILRTEFVLTGKGEPLQAVSRVAEMECRLLDWRGRDAPEDAFQNLRREEQARGFDLDKACLMRLILVQCDGARWRVIWSYHHIVMDGWSKYLLLKQVLAHYPCLQSRTPPPAMAARPFRDYIHWLQQQPEAPARSFWRTCLAGAQPTVLGETAAPGPPRFEHSECHLSAACFEQLERLARERQFTLNSAVQAGWGAILAHLSGNRDVLFGTTFSGRPQTLDLVDSMIGPFINTLPVRWRATPATRLHEAIGQMQNDLLAMAPFAGNPLTDVRRWSDLPATGPLFDSLVVFYNYPVDEVIHRNRANLRVEDLQFIEEDTFPLGLSARKQETLKLSLRYDARTFRQSTIEQIGALLLLFLEILVAQPDSTQEQLEHHFSRHLEGMKEKEKQNFRLRRFARRDRTTEDVPHGK